MAERRHDRQTESSGRRAAPAPKRTDAGARAGLPAFLKTRPYVDAETTRAAGATALTKGSDVALAPTAPKADTVAGRHLLGHELTHVLQQERAARVDPNAADTAHPALEKEADRAGDLAAHGMSPTTAAKRVAAGAYGLVPAVQRQPAPETEAPQKLELVPPPMLARAEGALTIDRFALDSAALTGDHSARLAVHSQTLLRLLRAYPGGSVRVIGHTDATGSEAHNERLGQERANAVRDALVAAGVDEGAVSATSAGESAPRIPSPQAEPRNRRVEIRFDPTSRIHFAPELKLTPPSLDTAPAATPPNLNLPPSYTEPHEETPKEAGNRIFAPIPPAPTTGGKSISKAFFEKVDGALGKLMERLGVPKELRGHIIDGAHAAIEKGAESLLDSALDGANVHGQERDAIKAAVKAAGQMEVK